MKRFSPMLLAILVLAGCRAPMPSFNLLAPYGSTRIPPPATGRVGPDTYYQPSRQPSSAAPVGTGFRARQSSTSLTTDLSSNTSQVRPASVRGESGQTRRATHQTTTTIPTRLEPVTSVVETGVVERQGLIRIVDSSTATRPLPSNLRGMRINEARVEPAPFTPTTQVIDITQLPRASSVRLANVVPANQSVGSSTGRPATSSRISSRSSSAGRTGWQARN